MSSIIKAVEKGSPAYKAGVKPGERLAAINGNAVRDVLDYKYYSYDRNIELMLESGEGSKRLLKVKKAEGDLLGLEFETYLMDNPHSCANKCIFCFVDQLPAGMRETLYFKDDDARMSFLMGNYITLTNLSEREIQRIIQLRISPINISIHATDPEVRKRLIGNPAAGRGYEIMARLSAAGIRMHAQIVLCPGINDGQVLKKSMVELAALYPQAQSVSIVPVGLTKHRDGLERLEPVSREKAVEVIGGVGEYSRECLQQHGSRIFFCADELFLKAGLPIPDEEYYEDYPQLENGVGLLRLLISEFTEALEYLEPEMELKPFSVATGVSAAPFLRGLIDLAENKWDNISGSVYAIENDFFGHSIDVAGLVTGGDLINQLRGKQLGQRLFIPAVMLRHGETVFLDDVSVLDVEKALGVPVTALENDGAKLLAAFLGKID